MRHVRERGGTLVEVLVATAIAAVGVLALVQLFSTSILLNLTARHTTLAAILAEETIERARDRASSAALMVSPAAALQQNTPGWVEHLTASGRVAGVGAVSPPDAIYTRRWSVQVLPGASGRLMLLQVLVTANRNRGAADLGSVSRLPGEARLATVVGRAG